LLRQRKVPKRKAARRFGRLSATSLCFSRTAVARKTRGYAAQTVARFPRCALRCSAAPTGVLTSKSKHLACRSGLWLRTNNRTAIRSRRALLRKRFVHPGPVGAAEHRRRFAIKRASCLSDCVFRNRELGARANVRGAQGTPAGGKPSGCPSLWLLSLGHARESNPRSSAEKSQPRSK